MTDENERDDERDVDDGPEAADRRAALAEIARWAALAPAVAVLVDPGTSHADLVPGGGD